MGEVSRRQVAPGRWEPEGPASPYVVRGYGGTLVVSISPQGKVDPTLPRRRLSVEVRCGTLMLIAKAPCWRLLGHGGFHASKASMTAG